LNFGFSSTGLRLYQVRSCESYCKVEHKNFSGLTYLGFWFGKIQLQHWCPFCSSCVYY